MQIINLPLSPAHILVAFTICTASLVLNVIGLETLSRNQILFTFSVIKKFMNTDHWIHVVSNSLLILQASALVAMMKEFMFELGVPTGWDMYVTERVCVM
jgi:hypothetical protein